MEKTDTTGETAEGVQNRVPINRIVLDTPAMLNMIKHCQDCNSRAIVDGYTAQGQTWGEESVSKARGIVCGVLKKEDGDEMHDIFITQIQPETSKNTLKDLKSIVEMDSDAAKLNDTHNEIGFYVSSHLGLAFSHANLLQLIHAYRNFRNSVMIVYDANKSYYGLNSLQGFRISEAAIKALNLNEVKFTD